MIRRTITLILGTFSRLWEWLMAKISYPHIIIDTQIDATKVDYFKEDMYSWLSEPKKPGVKKARTKAVCPFSVGQVIQHKTKTSVRYLILSDPEHFRRQRRFSSGTFWKMKVMMLRANTPSINGKIRKREFPKHILKHYTVISDIDISSLDIDTEVQ